MEIANVPVQAVGRELEPIRQLTLALASPGFTTEEKRAILKSVTETRSVGWLASDEGKARLQETQYIEPQGKLENLLSTVHDLSIMEGTALTDPLNLVPVLGFTKMDDLVTAARVLSRLGKTAAIRESAEVVAREAAEVGAREAVEAGGREAAAEVAPAAAPRFTITREPSPPSAGRAAVEGAPAAVPPAARPPTLAQAREQGRARAEGRAPMRTPEEAIAEARGAARPPTAGAGAEFVLTDHLPAPVEVAARDTAIRDQLANPKLKPADKRRLAQELGEVRAQEFIHRVAARTDIDPMDQLDRLSDRADLLGQRATLQKGIKTTAGPTVGGRAGRATPMTGEKIEQLVANAEENAIRQFIDEAKVVPTAEAGPRLAPRTLEAGQRPFPEEVGQPPLPGTPPIQARYAQPFGTATRQPEGLNPPPLELRSPEAKAGGLFEVPEAASWQAEIDAAEAAKLPPMGGGAMPIIYRWRGVAPSVVRPTKGLWAAVTNTVRSARGLPPLTSDDFLRQAEARAAIGNYGKGLEEASRVSQQGIVDYRRLVPKAPKLKAVGGNDAPAGLLGTELDALERPQAYKGGEQLVQPREWWQEYGRMDLADLERRGITVQAFEDYVFQHRYGGQFRSLGINDTAPVSHSLRGRMAMQKQRQFTTAYDAWKASEGGVAVAADKNGVLHTKLLPKGSTVKVGDSIQVGTTKAFGKEYPIMGRVEKIGGPLIPDVTDAEALVASRFEQSALLRAQKDLFDTVRESAVNVARKGVPQGYKTLNNLPGPLADLKLLVPDGAGNTRLVTVRKLAWPTKTADTLQGLLAPERLPAAAQTLTNAVSVLRDIRLNLDPSMITLIFSRYPLGHPITFLRNAKEFGAVAKSVTAWRQWVAEDPMVQRFIDGGGAGIFQRMEYMPGEAKPLVERFARVPGTPISLQNFNEETMRIIGYGTVKTAQVNEQVLRAVRGGMKIVGADKLDIPLTRIARMTDQEILEAAVKSATDQFGKLRYNDLGMSQWSKAAWRNSILTPGFLKTHTSLLLNSPKAFLGNPEGILGLVFLAQYVGLSLAVAEGLSQISGMHTSADPRDVNFGAVRTPFGTFTAMGQVRTYMRLYANLPGDLHAGYYDRLARSGISRLGIIPNELATQFKGEEYFGEPLGSPVQRLVSAGIRSLPIAFQTPIEIATGREAAIDPVLSSMADWTGATFWPRRTLDMLDEQMRKPVSQGGYGIGWWDAEPWQRQEVEDLHPELAGRAGEEQKMAARRGVISAQFKERVDQENTVYNGKLKNAVSTLVGVDLRNAYSEIQRERNGAVAAVERDPRFQDYLGKREERNAKTLAEARILQGQGKVLTASHLLTLYGTVFDQHEGEADTTALFADLDKFWAGLTPTQEVQLTRNLGLSLPPEIQAMRKEMRQLNNYWDKADAVWQIMRERYAEVAPYETPEDYAKVVQQRLVARGLGGRVKPESNSYLKAYNSATRRARKLYRLQNRSIDPILVKWYGYDALTTEGVQMAEELATAEAAS
jgi:hypothetical protein